MVLDGAEGLAGLALLDEAVGPEVLEDTLDDAGVVIGRGAVEDVGLDTEPVVDTAVEGVVLCAEGRRVNAFLESLGLGGSAVFVLEDWFVSLARRERCRVGTYGATNEQRLVVTSPAVSCKDVGGENATDEVAEVRNVVHIGQGAGNEDVALPGDWEDGRLLGLGRGHGER